MLFESFLTFMHKGFCNGKQVVFVFLLVLEYRDLIRRGSTYNAPKWTDSNQ